MDIHGALSALMQPMAMPAVSMTGVGPLGTLGGLGSFGSLGSLGSLSALGSLGSLGSPTDSQPSKIDPFLLLSLCSSRTPTSAAADSTSAFVPVAKKIKLEAADTNSPESPDRSNSVSTVSSTQLSSPQPSPTRKLAKPIPEERKDDAYFERRRKNNDAAKRSRDARRMKEEAVAARAASLEQENMQLRAQIALLNSETAKLQLLLFSNAQAPLASLVPPPISIEAQTPEPTTTITSVDEVN